MHDTARQIQRITGIERQRMCRAGGVLLIGPRRRAAWQGEGDVIPNAPGFGTGYLQHQHIMRIKMHAEPLRAGRGQIDVCLHRMQKNLFQPSAELREWCVQLMELRDNQAAPRIIAGEQARQINAAAVGVQIFIGWNSRTTLPPAIGHAHARMARGIGAEKRIQIGDGKQARVTFRVAPRQQSPDRAFAEREDLLRGQRPEGQAPGGFAQGLTHDALQVPRRPRPRPGPSDGSASVTTGIRAAFCVFLRGTARPFNLNS